MNKIPKLRFPEFSGEWEEKKLGLLLEFKNGINASKEQYGQGIKFINVLDILTNNFITYDKIIGKVDIDDEILNKYPVSYGDILFQRSSETREEVGTANVYLDKENISTFGGFVIRGKKIGEYNPIFMNKVLKTPLARNEITSKSGGSTRYNVGQETLSQVALFFPSLPEQEEIASFLSSVDSKIEKLERKKELWEQYKKGMMQKIFSQELRFRDENGEDYPEWEEKQLKEFGKLQGGYAFKSELFQNEGIPIIRISNISNHNNYIDTENLIYYNKFDKDEQFTIKKGNLIIAMSGATTGKLSIYNLEKSSYLNQRVGLFKIFDTEIYYNYVIQYCFSINFSAQIKNVLVAGAQPNISSKDIENFYFLLPSLPEQTLIADFLSSIDSKIEVVEKELAGMKEFKKGLLQKMFV